MSGTARAVDKKETSVEAALDFPIEIVKVETFVYRAPSQPPVRTSFGIMHDRPAVLVRVTDKDGACGWGEIWCNFPNVGAEHRARLLHGCLQEPLLSRAWPSPRACFDALTAYVRILAIQTGEPGPLAQVIAGIDIAMWDLVGKRLGQPLWKVFGGSNSVSVYTSGINPDAPERVAEAKAREGYTAFKLKVGFGDRRDEDNVRALRGAMGKEATLMVDANQAWTPERAAAMADTLAPYDLAWLEEPIPADSTPDVWRALTGKAALRIAGGENLRGEAEFQSAVDEGGLAVIQPDLGKWGGFSGCFPVARYAMAQGRWLCPHWLGGGIGLTASMHWKAGLGGAGYVEVDSNPNPLRDRLMQPGMSVKNGRVALSDVPGLGVEPDLADLRAYLVATHST
jgi:D-galactarolactone cycloisomerase